MDRQAGARVAHAVLGAEEAAEPRPHARLEQVGRVAQLGVDAGGVADEAEAPPREDGALLLEHPLQPHPHTRHPATVARAPTPDNATSTRAASTRAAPAG